MNWSHISQDLSDALGLVLVMRLLFLRLHSVYRIFCVFLLFELIGSVLESATRHQLDYRLEWMALAVIEWVLSLWVVYALLSATLKNLPGVLRFSKKLLNVVFLLALLVALWTARAEYVSSPSASRLVTPIDHALGIFLVTDRAICSAALVVILAILVFVLWFPVRLPKNLAVFLVGFVVYFAAKTSLLLAWSFWPNESVRLISNIILLIMALCCAYWAVFITAGGEKSPVRLGHVWHPREQERLIGQLEAMNASLLRAARR